MSSKRRRKCIVVANKSAEDNNSTSNSSSILNDGMFKKEDDETTWSIQHVDFTKKSANHFDKVPPRTSAASNYTDDNPAIYKHETDIFTIMRKHRPQIQCSKNIMIDNYYHNNGQNLSLPLLLYQRQIIRPHWNNQLLTMNKFMIDKKEVCIHSCKNESRRVLNKKRKSTIVRVSPTSPSSSTSFSVPTSTNMYYKKSQWKNYFKRTIPFHALKTPINDAVLGLDQTGSLLIAVADGKRSLHYDGVIIPSSQQGDEEDLSYCFDSIGIRTESYPSLSLRIFGEFFSSKNDSTCGLWYFFPHVSD